MALCASNLCYERDEKVLFKQLSVILTGGQVCHIKGHNGVGKTSLLKLLAGLLQPISGTVSWQGQDIRKLRHSFYQQLCFIGHHNAVNLQLSAYENLHFVSLAYQCKTSPTQALEQLGLACYQDLPAAQLSAGLRRRISLAKLALLQTPLWLLDEPYTSLDQDGIELVNQLINQHVADGNMVAISSHQEIKLNSVTPYELVLP